MLKKRILLFALMVSSGCEATEEEIEAIVLKLKAGLHHRIFSVRTGAASTPLLTIRKSDGGFDQPTSADLSDNFDIVKLFLSSSEPPCRDLVMGAFRKCCLLYTSPSPRDRG